MDNPLFEKNEWFMSHFKIEAMTIVNQVITVSYFAFTTLSTVGFGDLNARSDFERIFLAFIFLFGVLIFSIVMSNFIQILDRVAQINADLDEGDDLSRFFGLLKKFNDGRQVNQKLQLKIEKFFSYKWNNAKLMAINDDEEIAILSQLPLDV